ncbi:MAG: WbqC family protein [Desulfobulbaceae bacterium]|nr:WbqC family protein [Desulfobulbaceae bacterium]
MQPTYLPWIGYFEMIAASDVFIFLDDVQFSKKSWQQRNRVKGANGPFWLTIPVQQRNGSFQKIKEVMVDNSISWQKKHLKSIEISYVKSPYLSTYIDALRAVYEMKCTLLADFNITFILMLMAKLGIQTPTLCSSEMGVSVDANEKIIELCRKVGADELYDAAGARVFIDDHLFEQAGIKVAYQDYVHPEYRQLHGDFVSHKSVIDLLLNEGANSLSIIHSGAR